MAGRGKGKWIRRDEAQWRALLSRFSESALNVPAFGRREAVSTASFYRWRRLLQRHEGGKDLTVGSKPAFLDLGALRGGSSAWGACGTQTGSGWRVDLAAGEALMFFPEGQVRVHLYGKPVDMRRSFDGLYALTRQVERGDGLFRQRKRVGLGERRRSHKGREENAQGQDRRGDLP